MHCSHANYLVCGPNTLPCYSKATGYHTRAVHIGNCRLYYHRLRSFVREAIRHSHAHRHRFQRNCIGIHDQKGPHRAFCRAPLPTTPETRLENTTLPIIILIFLAFEVVHLIGWNFYFPTAAEQWLWRGTSLGCISIPIVSLATVTLMLWRSKWDPKSWQRLLGASQNPMMVIYVLCRLYMLVDMFVSLRDVPIGVYKTPQWSQYFFSIS
jgi:hypothetical protein